MARKNKKAVRWAVLDYYGQKTFHDRERAVFLAVSRPSLEDGLDEEQKADLSRIRENLKDPIYMVQKCS